MKDIKDPEQFVKTVLTSKVKIIDFGFSRILEDGDLCSTFIGNYNSMSKELTKGKYDFSSEIWAIGIITFHLLTGSPPFYSTNLSELNEKLHKGFYRFNSQDKPSVEIVDFIQMLLQENPSDRPKFDKIFNHPFLKKDTKSFKKCEYDEYLELSIYLKKKFLVEDVNSKLKEELILLNKSMERKSLKWNEYEFIDENYFEKKYQLHLMDVKNYEESIILNNNYFD
jgi:serine/threonine protein kinase